VSFLAKAPLFHMPIIGAIARRSRRIPVHRRQDTGADLQKNAETFEAARAVLVRGGTIAVFQRARRTAIPSCDHSRPHRAIALGAAAALPPNLVLADRAGRAVLPSQTDIRSVALCTFGRHSPSSESPSPQGKSLLRARPRTHCAARGSAAHGDARGRRSRCPRADRARQHIFSAADDAPERPPSLAEEFESVAGFSPDMTWRVATGPERAARLQARLERYEAALNAAGLDARHLAPRSLRMAAGGDVRSQERLVFLTAGLPAALIGGWFTIQPTVSLGGSRQE